MNHSSLKYKECEFCKNHKECRYKNRGDECDGKLSVGFYNKLPYSSDERRDWTFEGIVVACADEIAQRHHDIEDGIYHRRIYLHLEHRSSCIAQSPDGKQSNPCHRIRWHG